MKYHDNCKGDSTLSWLQINFHDYRIGSTTAQRAISWTFTYRDVVTITIRFSKVKDIKRYKLLIRSNAHLGDIEIVINDNSSINCAGHPQYDHYLDGSHILFLHCWA